MSPAKAGLFRLYNPRVHAGSDRVAASSERAVAANLIDDLNRFPLLRQFLRDQFGGEKSVSATIHPADEMVTSSPHLDQQDPDHSVVLYFRAGLLMLRAIEQVAAWRFRNLANVHSIFDFASGFGRLTRLLVRNFAPEQIAISEINRDAVEFQAREFGVHAYQSSTNPEGFRCDRRFDVVFAASFFTHLPEPAFRGWLTKLWSLLTPGGVLMFTLHNETTFRFRHPGAETELPQRSDFLFSESRFSSYLAPEEYGNTLVSDAFLSRVLNECLGSGAFSYKRISFGLGGFQDLCVIVPEHHAPFPALTLDYGPEGNLEGAWFKPDGKLKFSGWAASRNHQMPVEHIELSLDGRIVARAKPEIPRAEVEQYLGVLNAGWSCEIDVPIQATFDEVVQVRAITQSGLDWLIYIGSLGEALLRPVFYRNLNKTAGSSGSRVTNVEQHIRELEDTVARLREQVRILENGSADLSRTVRNMEASRFWRVRNQWFQLKRLLRLN